jgi:hypothetical protein
MYDAEEVLCLGEMSIVGNDLKLASILSVLKNDKMTVPYASSHNWQRLGRVLTNVILRSAG